MAKIAAANGHTAMYRAELKVTGPKVTEPNLLFPAIFCENLRFFCEKSAVFCGFLRP